MNVTMWRNGRDVLTGEALAERVRRSVAEYEEGAMLLVDRETWTQAVGQWDGRGTPPTSVDGIKVFGDIWSPFQVDVDPAQDPLPSVVAAGLDAYKRTRGTLYRRMLAAIEAARALKLALVAEGVAKEPLKAANIGAYPAHPVSTSESWELRKLIQVERDAEFERARSWSQVARLMKDHSDPVLPHVGLNMSLSEPVEFCDLPDGLDLHDRWLVDKPAPWATHGDASWIVPTGVPGRDLLVVKSYGPGWSPTTYRVYISTKTRAQVRAERAKEQAAYCHLLERVAGVIRAGHGRKLSYYPGQEGGTVVLRGGGSVSAPGALRRAGYPCVPNDEAEWHQACAIAAEKDAAADREERRLKAARRERYRQREVRAGLERRAKERRKAEERVVTILAMVA